MNNMPRNSYFFVGMLVVTLLGWQVWSMVKRPLQQQLYQADLQQVDAAMAAGDWAAARNWLADAKRLPVKDEGVSNREGQINLLTSDPVAERDFMAKNGNTSRSEILDIVLANYSTPKEILDAAGVLASKREVRLARIMIDQATSMDPNYTGAKIMRDYAASVTE